MDSRQSPLEAIRVAAADVAAAERALLDAVRAARAAGVSWARIGAVFGVSRQSVWERFAGRIEP